MSGKWQSWLCSLAAVPLAEAVAWAAIRAAGTEGALAVVLLVAIGTVSGVYAFGPARWLADADIGGWFGRDHPRAARLVCLSGVATGFGGAVLFAVFFG